MANCSKCNTHNYNIWIYCYKCGTKLTKHEDLKNSNTNQNLKICNNCNGNISKDDNICPTCDKKLKKNSLDHFINSIRAKWFVLTLLASLFASALFVLLSFLPNNVFSDLELNLGIAAFSICLTVTIVDKVIKKRDEEKWAMTSRILLNKINFINIKFITIFEAFLFPNYYILDRSIHPEVLDSLSKVPYTKENPLQEKKELNEKELVKILEDEALNFPSSNWDELFNELNLLNDEITEILTISRDINPEIYSQLFALQDILRISIIGYNNFLTYKLKNFESYIDLIRKRSSNHLAHALNHALYLDKLLVKSLGKKCGLFSSKVTIIHKTEN